MSPAELVDRPRASGGSRPSGRLAVVVSRRRRVLDLVEVVPGDVAVPEVGLVVGGRAAPALAGAFAVAGTQTRRVLLPDDGEAGVLGAVDRRVHGVALARGETLGLAPLDVPDHLELVGRRRRSRRSRRRCSPCRPVFDSLLDHAAAGPDGAERHLADLGEREETVVHPLGVVDRALRAGHAPDVERDGLRRSRSCRSTSPVDVVGVRSDGRSRRPRSAKSGSSKRTGLPSRP